MTQPAREHVTVSPDLVTKARAEFPTERTAKGDPSLADFERGPLESARQYFSRFFDEATPSIPGNDAIRQMTLLGVFFGPITFQAVRDATGITVLDYLNEDPDYWDIVGDDPPETR